MIGYPSRAFLDGAEAVSDPRRGLTAREYEILLRSAHGHSLNEIADALGISLHTVKDHTRRAYDKLGLEGELGGRAIGARLAAFRIFGWLKPPPLSGRLVPDEDIVDFGVGTEEQQAAAAKRIQAGKPAWVWIA